MEVRLSGGSPGRWRRALWFTTLSKMDVGRSDRFPLGSPHTVPYGRAAQTHSSELERCARPHTAPFLRKIHTLGRSWDTHGPHNNKTNHSLALSLPAGRAPGYRSRAPGSRALPSFAGTATAVDAALDSCMAPVSLRPIPAAARGLGSSLLAAL